jgi:hypothetical protein
VVFFLVIVDSPAETERELTPLHLCRDANPGPTGLETASEMAPGAKTRMLYDWASRGKNHLKWQVGLSFGSVPLPPEIHSGLRRRLPRILQGHVELGCVLCCHLVVEENFSQILISERHFMTSDLSFWIRGEDSGRCG